MPCQRKRNAAIVGDGLVPSRIQWRSVDSGDHKGRAGDHKGRPYGVPAASASLGTLPWDVDQGVVPHFQSAEEAIAAAAVGLLHVLDLVVLWRAAIGQGSKVVDVVDRAVQTTSAEVGETGLLGCRVYDCPFNIGPVGFPILDFPENRILASPESRFRITSRDMSPAMDSIT